MPVNAPRVLDEYLLASIRAGDAKAFELLARRWHKKLLGHAWRLLGGDAEGARDAVQEGWVEIVKSLPRLRDDRAFPAWAFRIVSRRCARQFGVAVRDRQIAADSVVEEHDAHSPESAGDEERLRAAVRACLPTSAPRSLCSISKT